jgi:hypothetical protein
MLVIYDLHLLTMKILCQVNIKCTFHFRIFDFKFLFFAKNKSNKEKAGLEFEPSKLSFHTIAKHNGKFNISILNHFYFKDSISKK